MKKMIISFLQNRAKDVLTKFHPKIVAITGSVGKTSTRKAITIVLSTKYKVRTAEKNFNNEIGVPLTILGMRSPGKNPFGWIKLFWKSYFIKTYPDVLVLEFGAYRSGDIAKLCRLAPPEVGVVTAISPVHAEYFSDINQLASEKGTLLLALPPDGFSAQNADDIIVRDLPSSAFNKKTYGTSEADIVAKDISLETRLDDFFEPGETFATTRARIIVDGIEIGLMELKNSIGYAPVMSCLASLCVAEAMGVSVKKALESLNSEFKPEPGRLNPLAGIKGSLIIDDSYNAAPASMKNGVSVLREFSLSKPSNRRIAVLGSMAELGMYSHDEHRMIGMEVARWADLFLAVGESMTDAVAAAKEAGMGQKAVEWFATSEEAGRYLDREIKTADIVYVKGSQSSRMEKVVKDIMARPESASILLVRQEKKWQDIT